MKIKRQTNLSGSVLYCYFSLKGQLPLEEYLKSLFNSYWKESLILNQEDGKIIIIISCLDECLSIAEAIKTRILSSTDNDSKDLFCVDLTIYSGRKELENLKRRLKREIKKNKGNIYYLGLDPFDVYILSYPKAYAKDKKLIELFNKKNNGKYEVCQKEK